jgi:hypothetical protein
MSSPNQATERIPAHSWYALGVLTVVYVLNFLDRVLVYILFPPIKAELRLTDLQLALLGTTSFVIFYTLLASRSAGWPTASSASGSSPGGSRCGASSRG